MITEALTEMKNHMRTYLCPFPETYPDRTKEMDFHTAIHLFDSHLTCVLFEMEKNGEEFPGDVVGRYAGNVIKYISEARERVNKFFRHDTPEDREYNNRLQQIEAEVITEEPSPPGHNPVDYSPSELALYFNKVCLWHQRLFTADAQDVPGDEIKTAELETINAKLLVLKQTKIYKFILENVCRNDKTCAAKLIAVITGEKFGPVRVAASYLETSHIYSKRTPYTVPAIKNAFECLDELGIDCKDLKEIYGKKNI